jgi:hypothetical protein
MVFLIMCLCFFIAIEISLSKDRVVSSMKKLIIIYLRKRKWLLNLDTPFHRPQAINSNTLTKISFEGKVFPVI